MIGGGGVSKMSAARRGAQLYLILH